MGGGGSLQVPDPQRRREEERRPVTVMFADLSGSTALAERLDPEDLRGVLGRFFAAMAREITAEDGTIDKYVGDAVMAVFGAPVAHEDDAARALRAALAMRRAIVELNDDLERERGAHLALRIGVNSGDVVAGTLAPEAQSAYTVVGETVHLAQRLQAAAEKGEIIVGPLTRRLTERAFVFDEPGAIHVKGREAPIIVSRLVGPRPVGPVARVASQLVGRDEQIGALLGRVRDLAGGRGGIVAVIGDAGVGKSRLVAEARARAANLGVRWLEGRAVATGQAIAYLPIREILRREIGIVEDDDASWSRLERRLDALFPGEVEDILPYLASLLAMRLRGPAADHVRALHSDAMGRQIRRAARRYVERAAAERPLAIVVEDLHWVDGASADLLEHLLPLVREVPLLICGVSRPELETAAARLRQFVKRELADHYHEIRLGPLAAPDADRLARNLLGENVPERVRALILDRAEGNPFYVEEVVSSLIDVGALVRSEEGAWEATSRIDEVTIPDTIEGVIVARLDRLEHELRQLLRTASVIGRSFLRKILGALADEPQRVEAKVAALEELDLIRERRRVPELEYAFKHVLTQQAAYDGILVSRRKELHHKVAEVIESLFADRLVEFYGVLAFHYARSEDWAKAQEYLFKAGDQAGRLAASGEALANYREAMTAYGRAFGDRWDRVERAALERKIGEALFHRGAHAEALEYFRRALEHLGQPFPRTRAGIAFAIARQLTRQIAHRLVPRIFVSEVRPTVEPALEERFRVYESMGWMDYYVAKDRLFLEVLLQLNLAERTGYAPSMVAGYFGLGFICDLLPAVRVAASYHRRCLALAEQIGHPSALAYANLGLAVHEHRLGRLISARDHWSEAARLFWQAGELRRWAGTAWGNAWVELVLGDPGRCGTLAEELLRVGRDGADTQALGWGHHIRGRLRWQTGMLAEAEEDERHAIDLLARVPDYPNLAAAYGDLGQALLRQGRLAEARDALEQSIALVRTKRLRGYLGTIRNGYVSVLLAIAEAAEGNARDGAMRAASRALGTARKQSRLDRETVAWLLRLEGSYAWLRGRRHDAMRLWERSAAAAAALGMPYDEAQALHEHGHRAGDAALVERAAAIFASLGARP